MKIETMNPAQFGLVNFVYVLERAGLIDQRGYRGLCQANRLDPDDPVIRKGVYAALAEQYLKGAEEGAKSLNELLALAERTIERELDQG